MESLLFGVIAVMGISMISTGWRLKQIWRLRRTETPVAVKLDSSNQQAYCWQSFHPNRIGISIARIGVPAINAAEFTIERKSLLERGPLLGTLRRLARLDLPSSCPMFDHFFKYCTTTPDLPRLLMTRSDIAQILVMQLSQGAIKGLSVRRLVCQRGILWIDIMMTRSISQLELNLACEQLIDRWVPTLATVSEALLETSSSCQSLEQRGVLSFFKEKTIQARSLVIKRSLRWGRLFQIRQSVSLMALMALLIVSAMSLPETQTTSESTSQSIEQDPPYLFASEGYIKDP